MAEIIDLYDVDRQLTGKTANRGDALEEGTYRMVVHVCIFNSKGEMLIQRRADDIVRWPSYWDVSVGGGASAGDTSRQAAERETAEELGLHIDFSERRPVISVNFSEGFDDFYTVEMDISLEDLHIQTEEVTEAKWASQKEIEEMIDDGSFIPYQKGPDRISLFRERKKGNVEPLKKIIRIRTGGQSGVDRAAMDFAREHGIPLCGWCPKNGWAEDYPDAPGLLADYPELTETPSEGTEQRTKWNMRDSDAILTIIPAGSGSSPGTETGLAEGEALGKPMYTASGLNDVPDIVRWISTLPDETELCIGGPRESECPEAYETAKAILNSLLDIEVTVDV